ncbi:hypothetical protein MferCBS31731_000355 [Microsporum ferrugineum]
MELGYGDQDLVYEEEAKRLAGSAPVPRPMCLACSKRIAEAPMLQCPQAHASTKCVQCAEANKPCFIVPSQLRGDLERIQALARESHVRPSSKIFRQLQDFTQKYVTKVEAYELKEPALEGYTPYQVPRPISPPVPFPSSARVATPMNSPDSIEETFVTKTRGFRVISQILSQIAEFLSHRIDSTSEREDVGRYSEATWLHASQSAINRKRVDERQDR